MLGRPSNTLPLCSLCACLLAPGVARADLAGSYDELGLSSGRFSIGGYWRLQALTDFQGGNGRLGLSTLNGRLLNEGPYGILMGRLMLVGSDRPSSTEPWAALTLRVEGDSFLGTDAGNGSLANYAITNFGVDVGNLLLENVTWRLGVIWYEPGDIDLYDMFPDDLFYGVAGASAFYRTETLELLVGLGDAGWDLHGANYDTVFTGGGWLRLHLGKHFQIAGGGQFGYEPDSPGNQNGPYQTPGVSYIDFYRHTAAQSYFQGLPSTIQPNPSLFPNPQPRSSQNWKLVGYAGVNGFGPLQWDNFFIHYLKQPPQTSYQELYDGQTYNVYIHDLTDQDYELFMGNEANLTLWPRRLDLAIAGIYGVERNYANTQVAGYDNYTFISGVARFQAYLTKTIHLLFETSLAEEHSLNGNLFRDHQDSIFQNDYGVSDPLGLQFGDSPYRDTWQGKWGVVFNPNGRGIYNRPSLRFLYGLQYSTAQDAFQSGYVNNLNQYNQFVGPEQHWHSVAGIETEGWF